MTQPADLYEQLKRLRVQLTAAQATVSDLLTMLGDLNLPDQSRAICPDCGLSLKGPRALAEHQYTSHGGPEPDHWLEAERKADW